MDTTIKNIAAAFVKAQNEFGPALRDGNNPHFRSKFATLESCIEAVLSSLNKHGIALLQVTSVADNGVIIETTFLHESGEMLSAGKLFIAAEKQSPQGYGSALTYARRYSLMCACGIAPEDDDGNSAEGKRTAPPVASSPAPLAVAMQAVAERTAVEGIMDSLAMPEDKRAAAFEWAAGDMVKLSKELTKKLRKATQQSLA